MGYARTEKGAKERVRMKHAIRRAGGTISNNATTTQIKKKYRQYKK